MEFLGKWRVKKTMFPTDEGVAFMTKDEILATGQVDPDDLEMFNGIMEVREDGTFVTLIQVPADQIEAAKAEGAPVDENGFICVDQTTWKEENGAYFYEMSGETVPFTLTEDGLLEYAMGMMLLERF